MDIHNANFGTGQVLAAADITNAGLQTLIRRQKIIGHDPIDMPGQPGIRRVFTFHSVMQIAAAKALMDIGVNIGDAFLAGANFAHSGNEKRRPGFPFYEGETWLYVACEKSVVDARPPGTPLTNVALRFLGNPVALSVLNTNQLFDRVCTALGYHPQEILDSTYALSATD